MVANFLTETLNTKNPRYEQQPQNTHDNGFFMRAISRTFTIYNT